MDRLIRCTVAVETPVATHLPTLPFDDGLKLLKLVRDRLAVGADAGVDGDLLHRLKVSWIGHLSTKQLVREHAEAPSSQLDKAGVLTTSQRDFSSYYLSMAPNYACLRGGRGLSERALINLFRCLWNEHRYLLAAKMARAILFHE